MLTSGRALVSTTREPSHKFLFVGFPQRPVFQFRQSSQGEDLYSEDLIFADSAEEAESYLNTARLAVVIAHSRSPRSIELLEKFEQENPQITRLLVGEGLGADSIQRAVNQGRVFRIYDEKSFAEVLPAALQESLQKYRSAVDRTALLKESTRQFRELEALNSNLEKIVHERTQHIEVSKIEEEEKLNKVRSLIRLIKELAQISSFEELLILLRKEFRKFHKVGDPVLVYQTLPDRIEFVSLQSGQVLYTHRKGQFPFLPEITIGTGGKSQEMIQILANHFGRPFAKTLYIPLEPKLMKESAFHGAQAAVCLEMSFSDVELIQFLDFIRERSQSIAITVDRLLLETELVQFSYRWEKTFDGFRDPIAIVDLDYEVLRANRKFSDKLVRKRCFESFANRNTPCDGCPALKAMEEGKAHIAEVRIAEKVFEVHSYPIVLDQAASEGRATNVVNQYVDVTQSRDLYLRMLQSEKLGAIGLLAGNIAHELNNPLTGLRSLAQVLIQEVQDKKELANDLLEIEKAASRSQQIIRNLLEFSTGTQQKVKQITMDEIVTKTMPMLKTVMRMHRQFLELDAESELIEVEPHLIQQVVFNLVSNACQAMKDPGTLTIRTRAENQVVILEVADTGPGVPVELREKIFEPFFTTKKEGLGTGLGLSLTKKIIENFGGKIELISEVGRGSLFRVSLPQKNETSK